MLGDKSKSFIAQLKNHFGTGKMFHRFIIPVEEELNQLIESHEKRVELEEEVDKLKKLNFKWRVTCDGLHSEKSDVILEQYELLRESWGRIQQEVQIANKTRESFMKSYDRMMKENNQLKEDALLGRATEYLFDNYNPVICVRTGGFEGEEEGFSISSKDQLIEGYKKQLGEKEV